MTNILNHFYHTLILSVRRYSNIAVTSNNVQYCRQKPTNNVVPYPESLLCLETSWLRKRQKLSLILRRSKTRTAPNMRKELDQQSSNCSKHNNLLQRLTVWSRKIQSQRYRYTQLRPSSKIYWFAVTRLSLLTMSRYFFFIDDRCKHICRFIIRCTFLYLPNPAIAATKKLKWIWACDAIFFSRSIYI